MKRPFCFYIIPFLKQRPLTAFLFEVAVLVLLDGAAVEHPTHRLEDLLLEVVLRQRRRLIERHDAFLELFEYQLADVFKLFVIDTHLVTYVTHVATAASRLDFLAEIP